MSTLSLIDGPANRVGEGDRSDMTLAEMWDRERVPVSDLGPLPLSKSERPEVEDARAELTEMLCRLRVEYELTRAEEFLLINEYLVERAASAVRKERAE